MFAEERQKEILALLRRTRSATVAQLSEAFYIGPATIRRDLQKLERQGLVRRTYGGAVLAEGRSEDVPLAVRQGEQTAEKEHIAKLAARRVAAGEVLILDSSTTTMQMVPHLAGVPQLTVVTNGLGTARLLGELAGVRVYCTGGRLRDNSLSLVGNAAQRYVGSFGVQRLFFSCRALSMEMGATYASDEEAELRRAMLPTADEVVLLCDHSKFGQKGFYHICGLDEVDVLVTDRDPGEAWLAHCRRHGVEVLF